jgi:hypothetical protein
VLLELPNGDLIIIDHKSAPIRREQVLSEASRFVGQLRAYREVLEAAGCTIAGVFVHFPLTGTVVNIGTVSQQN